MKFYLNRFYHMNICILLCWAVWTLGVLGTKQGAKDGSKLHC